MGVGVGVGVCVCVIVYHCVDVYAGVCAFAVRCVLCWLKLIDVQRVVLDCGVLRWLVVCCLGGMRCVLCDVLCGYGSVGCVWWLLGVPCYVVLVVLPGCLCVAGLLACWCVGVLVCWFVVWLRSCVCVCVRVSVCVCVC